MFLSREELVELTGRLRPSAQRRVLRGQGIDYAVTADGAVRVLRETVQMRLGAGACTDPHGASRLKPNWNAI